jgi:hypothetical protein
MTCVLARESGDDPSPAHPSRDWNDASAVYRS